MMAERVLSSGTVDSERKRIVEALLVCLQNSARDRRVVDSAAESGLNLGPEAARALEVADRRSERAFSTLETMYQTGLSDDEARFKTVLTDGQELVSQLHAEREVVMILTSSGGESSPDAQLSGPGQGGTHSA